MKHEFMVMTPKQSYSYHNGNPLPCQDKKTHQVCSRSKMVPVVFISYEGVTHQVGLLTNSVKKSL